MLQDMEFTLKYHLSYNCYPPVTHDMIPFCIMAIEKAKADDIDAIIEFPSGDTMTANEIIEDLNLGFYLQ